MKSTYCSLPQEVGKTTAFLPHTALVHRGHSTLAAGPGSCCSSTFPSVVKATAQSFAAVPFTSWLVVATRAGIVEASFAVEADRD